MQMHSERCASLGSMITLSAAFHKACVGRSSSTLLTSMRISRRGFCTLVLFIISGNHFLKMMGDIGIAPSTKKEETRGHYPAKICKDT